MSLEWESLEGLSSWVKDAISSFNFSKMTPVQASTIPLFLQNKDVIVESITGSGKTLSFIIPIMERLTRQGVDNNLTSIIISPTRELSSQIYETVASFCQFNESIKYQLMVGGINTINQDIHKFKELKPNLIIATPGRLLEFLNKLNKSVVKHLEVLIMDEADKLLDSNFNKEVFDILKQLPKQKRMGLFSATIDSITDYNKIGLRNPIRIKVNSKNHKPSLLTISYSIVEPNDKLNKLLSILNNYHFHKTIVYFPTCTSVDYFYKLLSHLNTLNNWDLKFFSLHGKLQTSSRLKTLDSFKSNIGKSCLLTTDVASRGIDIDDVDLVIQLDPPTNSDVFLHRCGRTARANKAGHAIVLLNKGREEDYIDLLQVKTIDLYPLEQETTVIDYSKQIHDWMVLDRSHHDWAIKSYVSFIRYYSKHTTTSIFRLQSLDYVSIAKMFGILRLPKMPELDRYLKPFPKDGYINEDVKFDDYKYNDPVKETARLNELSKALAKEQRLAKKTQSLVNSSWSKKALKSDRVNQELNQRKRDLELDDEDEEDPNQVTDWKDLVRRNKKEKKTNDIAKFDDL